MDKRIPSSEDMWIDAIKIRVEDMLKSHPEIDESSLSLLVETVGAGLRCQGALLNQFMQGSSFIESDFTDPEEEENTKLGTRKRTATKVSHILPNGRSYSITGPYYNSRRSRLNGNR